MNWIIIIRIVIGLTFLILVAGVPYVIIALHRFIRRYTVAHKILDDRVTALEKREETHGDPL